MVHDVAAVAPVGQRLILLLFIVGAVGEKNGIDREELRQFAHEGVKKGFPGGADGRFDQAVQPVPALFQ